MNSASSSRRSATGSGTRVPTPCTNCSSDDVPDRCMTNTPDHSPLGKTSAYQSQYAPELLFPIPRQAKRDELQLRADALPFFGVDIWNAYELSWLNLRGK